MRQGFVAPAVLCLEGCRAVALNVTPGSRLTEFEWLEKPEEREEDSYLVVQAVPGSCREADQHPTHPSL